MREMPVVVQMRDLVTGAIAVVAADAIPGVLDVWFPNVTSNARSAIDGLGAHAQSGDWVRVEEYGRRLNVSVCPMK